MKSLFYAFVSIVIIICHASAIVYTEDVWEWPRATIIVEETGSLISDSILKTQIIGRVAENEEVPCFPLDEAFEFTIPGGEYEEISLIIPGIPPIVPGHHYLISIPPEGIQENYMGPIVDIEENFDESIVVENQSQGNSPNNCTYARWNSYKWTYLKDTVLFKYYTGLSADFRSEFDAARDTWNTQSPQYISYDSLTTTRTDKNNVNTIDRYYLGQNETLAITYVYSDSFNHFIETDIIFNFSYPFSTSCSSAGYDFRSVAIHELGHVFGLGHVSDSSQVMYSSIGTGQCHRTLGCGDKSGIKAIYGDAVWNWSGDALGCTLHDALSCSFIDGRWKINPGSTNPYVQFPSKSITQTSHYKYIKIVGASNVSANRTARIYYRCTGQNSWPSDQFKDFPWNPVNGLINVTVSMGTINANKPWINNQIAQIRLFIPPQLNNNERVYLDYVKILNNY